MLFIGLIILMLIPVRSYALLRLPDSDLVWKNIRVDGKKKIVFCIFKDSRGLVWLGTDSGLYFYDGVTARPVRGGAMQGVQIHSIVEKKQSLFIGSNNGLLVYHLDTGVMDSYSEFSPKEIRSMLLVGNTLWMGSLVSILLIFLPVLLVMFQKGFRTNLFILCCVIAGGYYMQEPIMVLPVGI